MRELATPFTRRDAFRCFDVVSASLRCRAAPKREPLHDYLDAGVTARDAHPVIDLHGP